MKIVTGLGLLPLFSQSNAFEPRGLAGLNPTTQRLLPKAHATNCLSLMKSPIACQTNSRLCRSPLMLSLSSDGAGAARDAHTPSRRPFIQNQDRSGESVQSKASAQAKNGVEKRTGRHRLSSLLTSKRPLPKGSYVFAPRAANYERQSAIVLIPGTHLYPAQYTSLAKEIQAASSDPIWIAIPKIPFNAPNPASSRLLIQQSIHALKQHGFSGDYVMLAGHSLGGIFLPKMVSDLGEDVSISSLLMLGSYVLRGDLENDSLSGRPSLTIAGELDGLTRPARLAEDYYHHIIRNNSTEASKLQHAVVLINGMNHMQYADGKVPLMVRKGDLSAEIGDDEARQQVAQSVVEFIDATNGAKPEAQEALLTKVGQTGAYLAPLIEAMHLEGNYHFTPPCHLDDSQECTLGAPWSEWAQRQLANVTDAQLNVTDEFHHTWMINVMPQDDEPLFYHPSIDGLSENEDGQLTLHVRTATEAVYDRMDAIDNARFPNTARELRTKFNSREAILHALGQSLTDGDSEQTDICSRINQKTIEWALDHAPERVVNRYLERGIQLVIGKDIEHSVGPAWIWSYLELNKAFDEMGREVRVVNSHAMKTPLTHPVPFNEGKHYCKLLSPAFVLDWLYTGAYYGGISGGVMNEQSDQG